MSNLEDFIRERDEALLSGDIEKVRAYLRRQGEVPHSDPRILMAGIHRARLTITYYPESVKEESRRWLKEHGFRPIGVR